MEVVLTDEQKAFANEAIRTGRFDCEEEAVIEALQLWQSRERVRAEILACVDAAERSLARVEGKVITQQSLRDLAEDVKARGRARLAADQTAAG